MHIKKVKKALQRHCSETHNPLLLNKIGQGRKKKREVDEKGHCVGINVLLFIRTAQNQNQALKVREKETIELVRWPHERSETEIHSHFSARCILCLSHEQISREDGTLLQPPPDKIDPHVGGSRLHLENDCVFSKDVLLFV